MKNIYKSLLTIIAVPSIVFAFTDKDMDGVDDSIDKCPNTPFLEIVGPDGCPISKPKPEKKKLGRFYFKIGAGYNTEKSVGATYSSVSLAYAIKGFYVSWTTLYYINDEFVNKGGMGDSYFYTSYTKYFKNVYATAGLNIKVPTGDKQFSDEKFDFTPSVSLDYIRGKDDYFIYYGYTFKGDNTLKDVNAVSIGGGYQFTKKFYSSLSLDAVSSAVSGKMKYTASYFGLYNFTRRYYSTLSYSYGLNDLAVDHSIFLKLGIRF